MAESYPGILGFGAYVPKRIMHNDEWAEFVETSDQWIRERTGIRQRRIAAKDEHTTDLALAACREALRNAGVLANQLDEIIVATDTPEVFIPDTASFLQDRLGAQEIAAYDLAGSGCAGFVLGFDIALARVLQARRTVLVVGVELLSRLMNWEDRNTCVLFGDAAGAAVVGYGTRPIEILASTAGTDGSQASILTLEAGGTRVPISPEVVAAGLHKKIEMNGRKVFKEAVSRMSAAAHTVLQKAGVKLDEVDLIIPHQANHRIISAVTKVLELDADRVFSNVHAFGNTGSASVPLALWDAHNQGLIREGNLVLLTAFGAGFHWSAVLLRF
jgi:3-oxoacyl-[acyl-carrier-protein] synthase-3